MQNYRDWEVVGQPLGEGGQSVVHLVRAPGRVAERASCLLEIRSALDGDRRAELAEAITAYARPDSPSELGALKIFDKVRKWGAAAELRLKSEIAILRENRTNLPRLLDANETEKWIVTEYFPERTLEYSPYKYKGEPVLALKAFRSLVETVATSLHKDNIVHRDIKPANVFIRSDGTLIPGDFGIVYLPDQHARLTITDERVGPWDYMPQWGDLGERLEKVQPNFDVYMLGKLLWCMIAGRMRLPREYHRRPEFDLAVLFPQNRYMQLINFALDKCLVENPHECLASASELLKVIDESLAAMDRGGPLLNEKGDLTIPCRACGKGFYQSGNTDGIVKLLRFDEFGRQIGDNRVRVFVCDVCTNYAFFAPNYPDEAAKRGWTPWGR